jgi:hypothetical protein
MRTLPDWPTGSYRTTATFAIETVAKRGQRAVRTTLHPLTGKPSAPKKLTFARAARIVDGNDGRTYIAELTVYGFVSIMRGDMKIQHESIFPDDQRYAEVRALFE